MKDIEAIKKRLLIKYPFFGSIIANVKYIEKESTFSAATDGENIYYNPDYLDTLEKDTQLFLFAHEVCHIAFNHIKRSEGKNIELWNIATDAVINQLLIRDGLKIMPGGIDIKEAINYNAEQFYQKLLKENIVSISNVDNKRFDIMQIDDKKDLNNHTMWYNKNNKKEDNDDITDEKSIYDKNVEERNKRLEELKRINIAQSTYYGNNVGGSIISINNIGRSKPLIDWRFILKEAVKYEEDWSYQNASIENNVLVPNIIEIKKSETEILLDTSGSISHELLRRFLKECKNILPYTMLKVGCFDTEFYGFNRINTVKDLEEMEIRGHGGTDFELAVNSFSKNATNKILFTDGAGIMPKTHNNIIWMVYEKQKINPKGGKVFYVNEELVSKGENKIRKRI